LGPERGARAASHCAGCDRLQCRHQHVQASGTSRPCISYVRCSATPRCCHQRVRRGPAAPAGLTVRGDRTTALKLLLSQRQMQRHAIAPDMATYSAAISACESASSTSRPYISCGRCSAMSLRRRKSFTVLPPAHAKESAAPVDLTSLRPVRRYVIVPEVVTYSAASSAGERASNISRPHISWGRGSVTPACRIWSFTVLPSARAKVSSTSRHYISCGRGSAMPSCRMWSPTVLPSARAKEPAAPADIKNCDERT